MSFTNLGLRAELLNALASANYHTPTPIQAEAIPVVLSGRDLLAGAQTGTGKTAGFTLPLLQRLMPETIEKTKRSRRMGDRPVRALILVPTRELAMQVEASVRTYGRYLPFVSTVIVGGVNLNPQRRALHNGVDIVVATPGRLLDHVNQGNVDLSGVEILVMDEADRLLDMGFIRDIRKIASLITVKRQTLMFSATFSKEIKMLAEELLIQPAQIQIASENKSCDLVAQSIYKVSTEMKRDLLLHLLAHGGIGQALVFTRTKHGADRLHKILLQNKVSAVVIHGNRSQNQRTFALGEFKQNKARILVATDVAARGLDIQQLEHVINYELPPVPEDYIHRIGRTGRAGNSGNAISLVSNDDMKFLRSIERLLGKPISQESVEGFAAPRELQMPREESLILRGAVPPPSSERGGDRGHYSSLPPRPQMPRKRNGTARVTGGRNRARSI